MLTLFVGGPETGPHGWLAKCNSHSPAQKSALSHPPIAFSLPKNDVLSVEIYHVLLQA